MQLSTQNSKPTTAIPDGVVLRHKGRLYFPPGIEPSEANDTPQFRAWAKMHDLEIRDAGEVTAGGTSAKSEDIEPSPMTDLTNSERFTTMHGEDVRYCHQWNRWLVWDGKRWVKDEAGLVKSKAKQTVRAIYHEAAECEDDKLRKELVKWAKDSESQFRIKAMVNLAESALPINPDELDTDPWLLNCQNGTLDLKSDTLHPHRREDFITKICPVDYDPNASAPTWEMFLNRIMGGNKDLIEFLKRAGGLSLTGDTSERVIFLMYGTGANGKTVYLETLRGVMGDYSLRTPTETLLIKRSGAIPNDIARLRGARFVTASEVEQGQRLAESLVKDLTGSDTVSARFMHGEFFDFRPECKVWLATNHKPIIKGTEQAIWDRIRLIPFAVTIPEGERDPKLLHRLLQEAPGILNWLVQGCMAWQHNGLGTPNEVRKATQGYREEMDTMGSFLSGETIIEPQAEVGATALYKAYQQWCDENSERPMTGTAFGRALTERGFEKGNHPRTRKVMYKGLGLVCERV